MGKRNFKTNRGEKERRDKMSTSPGKERLARDTQKKKTVQVLSERVARGRRAASRLISCPKAV